MRRWRGRRRRRLPFGRGTLYNFWKGRIPRLPQPASRGKRRAFFTNPLAGSLPSARSPLSFALGPTSSPQFLALLVATGASRGESCFLDAPKSVRPDEERCIKPLARRGVESEAHRGAARSTCDFLDAAATRRRRQWASGKFCGRRRRR